VIQVTRSAEPDENIRIPENLGLFTWRGHSAITRYILSDDRISCIYIDEFGINIIMLSSVSCRAHETLTEVHRI
jgi:hypothetical protein